MKNNRLLLFFYCFQEIFLLRVMFDWNGNGKIDTDDQAFTAFLIDEVNRKAREKELAESDIPEDDDSGGFNTDDD